MKNKKAFSLIEILAALTIGSIILLSAYMLFDLSNKTWLKTNSRFEVRQNARIAIERMSRDIRQSIKIINELPSANSSSPNFIKFEDGHIVNKIQYITYQLNGTNLTKIYSHYSFDSDPATWVYHNTTDGGGNSPSEIVDLQEIVAENIEIMEFWGSSEINFSLLVKKSNYQEEYQTTVLSRNIL